MYVDTTLGHYNFKYSLYTRCSVPYPLTMDFPDPAYSPEFYVNKLKITSFTCKNVFPFPPVELMSRKNFFSVM